MAASSPRGLKLLSRLFSASRQLSSKKCQATNLSWCEVSRLHYVRRYCSSSSSASIPDSTETENTVQPNNDTLSKTDELTKTLPSDKPFSQDVENNVLSSSESVTNNVTSQNNKNVISDNKKGEKTSACVTGDTPVSSKSSPEPVTRGIGRTEAEQESRLNLDPDTPADGRVLQVSIIGVPNSGKSTLTNSLMNWKVSSVSPKVHTTRRTTLAIDTQDNIQIVYLDTPGLLQPGSRKRHSLDTKMESDPQESLIQADIIGVLVDADDNYQKNELDKRILKLLYLNKDKPSVLILNKVDKIKQKKALLNISQRLTAGMLNGVKITNLADNEKSSIDDIISRYQTSKSKRVNKPVEEMGSIERNEERDSDHGSDYDRYDRYDYEDDYRSNAYPVSPDRLQAFLRHTKSKITYYREHQDEARMKATESNDVIDDVRYRLQQLSVGLMPKLDGVVEKAANQHGVDMRELEREVKGMIGWPHFSDIFMISAKSGDGIDDLKEYLRQEAKDGDWKYHSSLVTPQTPQEIVTKIFWEKMLVHLDKDIPYNNYPKITTWEVTKEDSLFIQIKLYPENRRYFNALLSEKGLMMQQIQRSAHTEVKNALRCEVILKVFVENPDRGRQREGGYDRPRSFDRPRYNDRQGGYDRPRSYDRQGSYDRPRSYDRQRSDYDRPQRNRRPSFEYEDDDE